MQGEKRKLLCLLAAQREPALLQDLAEAGWDLRLVERHDEARRLIASGQYSVGIALFTEAGDWDFLDGRADKNAGKTRPAMEWIALVQPELMHLATLSRRIRTVFFDYHSLPADSQRLLLTLGHAYGMATLGGNLAARPLQAGKTRPPLSLHRARRMAEQAAIEHALHRTRNNVTLAARELGISRVTLYRLLEKSRVPSNT